MEESSKNYTSVKTFSHPQQLAIIRGRLEADGIEYLLQGELTGQVSPIYSNSIGGVNLQVKKEDISATIKIIRDSGYEVEENPQLSKLYILLDKATSKIPLIKKLNFLYRLAILTTIIISIVVYFVYVATLPSLTERLTKNFWCLDYATIDGKNYLPKTTDYFQLNIKGECPEEIIFFKNGQVIIPGFNSFSIHEKWKVIDKNTIEISPEDATNGDKFDLDFSNDGLILKSNRIIFDCHANHF